MSLIRIIGVDPGFANIGLCIVDYYGDARAILVDTKFIKTDPTKGKAGNLDDEKRRLEEIEDSFKLFLDLHRPSLLAIEEPGKCLMRRFNPKTRKQEWATNPALLRTSCLMWGAIHGICRDRGIPCIKVGSQEIKQVVCNKNNASKEEVIKAVKLKFTDYDKWPTTKKIEHIADAVGAALTVFNNPLVLSNMKDEPDA